MSLRNFIMARTRRAVKLCAVASAFLLCAGNAWGDAATGIKTVTETLTWTISGTNLQSLTSNNGYSSDNVTWKLTGTSTSYKNSNLEFSIGTKGATTSFTMTGTAASGCTLGTISNFTIVSRAGLAGSLTIAGQNQGSILGSNMQTKSVQNISSPVSIVYKNDRGTSGSVNFYLQSFTIKASVSHQELDYSTLESNISAAEGKYNTMADKTIEFAMSFKTAIDNAKDVLAHAEGNKTELSYASTIVDTQDSLQELTTLADEYQLPKSAIVWNQDFSALSVSSQDITLGAYVANAETQIPINGAVVSYTLTNVTNNCVSLLNGNTLVINDKEGTATITATFAQTDQYQASSASRVINVSAFAKPQWQNNWAAVPANGAQFYLYNKNADGFVEAGKGENSSFVNYANASLWTFTNKQLQNGSNKIGNRTSSASSNGDNAHDYTFVLKDGLFRIYYNSLADYSLYADNGKFSAHIGTNYEWYLVSQDQMDYHVAAVDAINAYLVNDDYAIITGAVRTNLEDAVHATGDWVNARTVTLPAAIAAFVAEYNAIDTLSLANCDGYQMLYTGENNVKILDQTAVAKIATWNGENLVLATIASNSQVIPAHTSVLIHDNTDTECVYTITQDAAEEVSENAFEYHDSSTMGEHTDYVLSKSQDGVVAFRKYTGTDTVADRHNVLVWRATPEAQAPAVIRIVTEEMIPTALEPAYTEEDAARPNDNRIFTIMGYEVSDMSHPGIYIQNGKKFIVY